MDLLKENPVEEGSDSASRNLYMSNGEDVFQPLSTLDFWSLHTGLRNLGLTRVALFGGHDSSLSLALSVDSFSDSVNQHSESCRIRQKFHRVVPAMSKSRLQPLSAVTVCLSPDTSLSKTWGCC